MKYAPIYDLIFFDNTDWILELDLISDTFSSTLLFVLKLFKE